MKSSTKKILSTLNFISWVVFIGVGAKTGSILISFFISHFINSEASKNLYLGLNLYELFNFNITHYSLFVSMIILITGLKAFLFYFVIKIFTKINFVQPFSQDVSILISKISYVALGIWLLTFLSNFYSTWLYGKGVNFSDIHKHLGGGEEFFLLGGVIFIIAQVFKRGIEIQSENELTV